MSKQKKSVSLLTVFLVFVAITVFVPVLTKAGELEPSAPPGSTMKTLDEIPPTWSQTLSPTSKRFVIVLNKEAVLDKETGLVWAKAGGGGQMAWGAAVNYCADLVIGNRKGWRLPTREELASLIDPSQSSPALPPGYSAFFDDVETTGYWASTTGASSTEIAWGVNFFSGSVYTGIKSLEGYVLAVRSGH